MKTWQKIKENPDLIAQYLVREKVVDGIRAFFKHEGFREVETPLLVPSPSTEPFLEVFETKLKVQNAVDKRAFLITSPEFYIKKLLAAGIGNCFEICKVFRNNEGISPHHNMEFTMLEWYRVGADYLKVMEDFERLFLALAGSNSLVYQGTSYDLATPWTRISVAEAFLEYAKIDNTTLLDDRGLIQAAKNKGYNVNETTTWEEIYHQILLNEIEPKLKELNRPVFLYDYPVSQAALSRKKEADPRFSERFEVYLAGLELGNAFSELTDAVEQEARLKKDLEERKTLGKTEYEMDEDFIMALKSGMPTTAGIAVGVDRLVMLLADKPDITQTLFFPMAEIFNLR